MRTHRKVDPFVRFFSYVQENDSGCWVWLGGKSDKLPYGCFWYCGKQVRAHRFAWEVIAKKHVPDGLQLDHLCRNPSCVNPAHLEVVTAKENVLRGGNAASINAKKVVCIRGHEFNEENTYVLRGKRYCRACARAKEQRRRAAMRHNASVGRN